MSNQAESGSKRVESLDAFRGIASFLIMITHFILCVPEVCQAKNLTCIYGGLSWKLPYFFILSGFVLTISYERSKNKLQHPFRSFLASRFLRIYPLFFITTVIMYLLKVIFDAGTPVDEASIFFNISWQLSPTFITLIHSLTLIGLENTWLYNGPAWTLVFEMRYALFFPLFFYILRRTWLSLLLFIGAAFIAADIAGSLEVVDLFYAPDQFTSNSCSMICFLLFYSGGILLAIHRERLSKLYNSLSRYGQAGILIMTIIAVINPLWIKYIMPSELNTSIGNCIMLLGVATWIIILLNNKTIAAIFSKQFLITIGRSSFSIYMWHTPIFTMLYMTLYEIVNIWIIILLSTITSLIVAQLSFRYIEKPIIALSHRLRG